MELRTCLLVFALISYISAASTDIIDLTGSITTTGWTGSPLKVDCTGLGSYLGTSYSFTSSNLEKTYTWTGGDNIDISMTVYFIDCSISSSSDAVWVYVNGYYADDIKIDKSSTTSYCGGSGADSKVSGSISTTLTGSASSYGVSTPSSSSSSSSLVLKLSPFLFSCTSYGVSDIKITKGLPIPIWGIVLIVVGVLFIIGIIICYVRQQRRRKRFLAEAQLKANSSSSPSAFNGTSPFSGTNNFNQQPFGQNFGQPGIGSDPYGGSMMQPYGQPYGGQGFGQPQPAFGQPGFGQPAFGQPGFQPPIQSIAIESQPVSVQPSAFNNNMYGGFQQPNYGQQMY